MFWAMQPSSWTAVPSPSELATAWDIMTLGKQVLLFFSKEDSEHKKETLLKLLYKVKMKKEGTKEVDHRVGSDWTGYEHTFWKLD